MQTMAPHTGNNPTAAVSSNLVSLEPLAFLFLNSNIYYAYLEGGGNLQIARVGMTVLGKQSWTGNKAWIFGLEFWEVGDKT
jgi:hypothetical protein